MRGNFIQTISLPRITPTIYSKPSFIPYFEYRLFHFFGMVVGKAIYEGILLKCSFARFFLNSFTEHTGTGSTSSCNSVDDLRLLEPDIYSNLMKLKYYDGNIEDLGLTFAVTEDLLGTTKLIPLQPKGD